MKHTQKEILKALHIIKDECSEHVACEETCPFSRGASCLMLKETPNNWTINDDSVSTWKGLL